MSPAKREPTTEPIDAAKAHPHGNGASAQGQQARAVGSRGVIIDGENRASINTGDLYQTIINQADRPGADATQLRNAYLAWLSLRANELPLFADTGGRQAQLAAVYTALLTRGRAPASKSCGRGVMRWRGCWSAMPARNRRWRRWTQSRSWC